VHIVAKRRDNAPLPHLCNTAEEHGQPWIHLQPVCESHLGFAQHAFAHERLPFARKPNTRERVEADAYKRVLERLIVLLQHCVTRGALCPYGVAWVAELDRVGQIADCPRRLLGASCLCPRVQKRETVHGVRGGALHVSRAPGNAA